MFIQSTCSIKVGRGSPPPPPLDISGLRTKDNFLLTIHNSSTNSQIFNLLNIKSIRIKLMLISYMISL